MKKKLVVASLVVLSAAGVAALPLACSGGNGEMGATTPAGESSDGGVAFAGPMDGSSGDASRIGDPGLAASCSTAANRLMPVEVFSPSTAQATESVVLTAPAAAAGAPTLSMMVHNLNFQAKASVQVNDGAWIDLTNTTAGLTVHGAAAKLGGIGGSISTLKLSLALPTSGAGSFVAGANTVSFRLNKADGLSSGYRVVRLDALDASGASLLGALCEVDPSTWTAPAGHVDAASVDAGQTAWMGAALEASPLAPGTSLKAHCTDCHSQDGRDLKYFNFSNDAIIARAQFHGLSADQGADIAAFIRQLPSAASKNGRPWNPVYQPGPGTSASPISEWAAGAGIDAVLDEDSQAQAAFPGGLTDRDALMTGNRFNDVPIHDVPVSLTFLTWNQWLPQIHPFDFVNASGFASDPLYTTYLKTRQGLSGKLEMSATDYVNREMRDDLAEMGQTTGSAATPFSMQMGGKLADGGIDWSASLQMENYALAVWTDMKTFEIMQEFGLEGLGRQFYGVNGRDPDLVRRPLSLQHLAAIALPLGRSDRSVRGRPGERLRAFLAVRGDARVAVVRAAAGAELGVAMLGGLRVLHHRLGLPRGTDRGARDRLVVERGGQRRVQGADALVHPPARHVRTARRRLHPERSGRQRVRRGLVRLEPARQHAGLQLRPGHLQQHAARHLVGRAAGRRADHPHECPDVPREGGSLPARAVEPGDGWRHPGGGRHLLAAAAGELAGGERLERAAVPGSVGRADRRAPQEQPGARGGAQRDGRLRGVVVARFDADGQPYRLGSAPGPARHPRRAHRRDRHARRHQRDGELEDGGQRGQLQRPPARQQQRGVHAGAALRDGHVVDRHRARPRNRVPVRRVGERRDQRGRSVGGGFGGGDGRDGLRLELRRSDGGGLLDRSAGERRARHRDVRRSTSVDGKIGQALAFDGVSQFVSVPLPLHRWLGQASTFATWFRTSGKQANAAAAITGNSLGSQGSYEIGVVDASGHIGVSGWAVGEAQTKQTVFGTSTVNDGAWHHLAVTRSAAGVVTVYVDGTEEGSGTVIAGTFLSPRLFSIGRTDGTLAEYWQGALDDVRVYDEVLSASDVKTLATSTTGL